MKKTLFLLIVFILASCSSGETNNSDTDEINDVDEVQDIDAPIDFTFDETRYYSTVSYNNYFFVATEKEGILVYKMNKEKIGEPVASIDLTSKQMIKNGDFLYCAGSYGMEIINIKDPENPIIIAELKAYETIAMSTNGSNFYSLTVGNDGITFLNTFIIREDGKLEDGTYTELNDDIYSAHFGENFLVTLEQTEDDYFMVIRDISEGKPEIVSTYQLPSEYPGYSNFAFSPIWASVYQNNVYVFMYQLNSVSGSGPEHLSVLVDISDLKTPSYVKEMSTDAPSFVKIRNTMAFFVVPEFSYHLHDKIREVDLSKPSDPVVTHEFDGNYVSVISGLRLTSHFDEGLRLYNVTDEEKLVEHKDTLSSAINVDISDNTIFVRNAEGRIFDMKYDLPENKPKTVGSYNLSVSTDNLYFFDDGKIYECLGAHRSSTPSITEYSYNNDSFSRETFDVSTNKVQEYSELQINGNMIMIVPKYAGYSPAIISRKDDETETYDNSYLKEADHYSLKGQKIATGSENSIILYGVTSMKDVKKIVEIKIESAVKDILLEDPRIYVVDSTGIKMFEQDETELSLKEHIKIELDTEKPVKIKKIGEMIAFSQGSILRIFDPELSDNYKTLTYLNEILDFSIKDNVIITALDESGLHFKEIKN